MMPFIKVTDMSYHRSVPGRIFGYGEFILESAGQDQALRKVEWVPHPDATYRIICAEIFGLPNPQRIADSGRDDGFLDDGTGGGGPSPPVPAGSVPTRWDGPAAAPVCVPAGPRSRSAGPTRGPSRCTSAATRPRSRAVRSSTAATPSGAGAGWPTPDRSPTRPAGDG